MSKTAYQRGLHELGNGCFAYLQPDGSWGWNNAGLVVDGDQTLLVDTLFDPKLTHEMLEHMRRAVPAAAKVDTLVNTHANGDHCWGNQLFPQAKIIASEAGAAEMQELSPKKIAMLMKVAKVLVAGGKPVQWLGELLKSLGSNQLADLNTAAPFVLEIFQDFDFDSVELTAPNQTFCHQLEFQVGDRQVQLLEVGPAHTEGDVLVFVPQDKVVYTGDILFHQAHPIIWSGPVSNWIKACDEILSRDVVSVVPGHGALADQEAVRHLKAYLAYIQEEARARYDAGMAVEEAARDIAFEAYKDWGEAERIVVNLQTLYREFSGQANKPDVVSQFAAMARLRRDRRG